MKLRTRPRSSKGKTKGHESCMQQRFNINVFHNLRLGFGMARIVSRNGKDFCLDCNEYIEHIREHIETHHPDPNQT